MPSEPISFKTLIVRGCSRYYIRSRLLNFTGFFSSCFWPVAAVAAVAVDISDLGSAERGPDQGKSGGFVALRDHEESEGSLRVGNVKDERPETKLVLVVCGWKKVSSEAGDTDEEDRPSKQVAPGKVSSICTVEAAVCMYE